MDGPKVKSYISAILIMRFKFPTLTLNISETIAFYIFLTISYLVADKQGRGINMGVKHLIFLNPFMY